MMLLKTQKASLGPKRSGQAGITLIELLISMIILTIVSTMLVGGWISLQRSYAFAAVDNAMRATARDGLNRISSEIRTAQPPTDSSTTPFELGGVPYACDGYHCVFYSAYNNPLASSTSGARGLDQAALTAIWLDSAAKKLYWQRGTRTVTLANNVVNAAMGVPVFAYNFRSAGGTYTQSNSLTSANVAILVSVQVEVLVDVNLNHTPTHIDLRTTVEPRNQIAPSPPS